MAEIEMRYIYPYCALHRDDYCEACHGMYANEFGCEFYKKAGGRIWSDKLQKEVYCVREGCAYADIDDTSERWVSAKNYDIHMVDDETFGLYMGVTINGKTSLCTKVVLNGKCIYDEIAETEQEGER